MRLRLAKDTLTELGSDELTDVVGGVPIPTWYDGCVTTVYPSIECPPPPL